MVSISNLFNDFMNLVGINYYSKTECDEKYALTSDIPSVDSSLSDSSENPVQNKIVKGALDNKAGTSHTHGNISNDGKVGSESGKILTTTTGGSVQASSSISKSLINDFPTEMTPSSHNHSSSEVKEASALSNIGSSANATQHTVNDNINTKLGLKANSSDVYTKSETYTQSEVTTAISNAVGNLALFEVVESLPTTNIKTNRLYLIVNEENIANNSYDIYLRVNNAWEQVDKLEFDISNYYTKTETDTLLNGKVNTDDNRLTNARTPTSHTHGDITNTGTIGSTANLPLITTTNGKIATGTFGTSSGQFAEGNHNHYINEIPTYSGNPLIDEDATTGEAKFLYDMLSYDGTTVTLGMYNRTTGYYDELATKEDIPTVPSASSTTPSADTTNGSVGSGTTWAKADHTHPKSTLYAEANDVFKHLRYIYLTSSMVGGTNSFPVVTYSDDYGEVDIDDVVIIYNHTGSDLTATTQYKINSNNSSSMAVYGSNNLVFPKENAIIAVKTSNTLYEGFILIDKYVTFIKNDVAYNNIKSGESTSLSLTNQKLINDAVNTKFGNMDTVSVVVTYTDGTTETLNLFKYIGN